MADKEKDFLSIKDLVVEYTSDGKVIHAVNGVSLDLQKGETLGLVGETGAGKTTIAQSILRILPDPPAKIKNGEIWFEGENLLTLHKDKMRHIRGAKISMIFQDPMTALNPTMRIGQQLVDGIRLHNKQMSKKQAEERALEMLELVGIPRFRAKEYPHQFSGGMKQRVIIAIALACEPDLLLADEPTTALDVTIQAQVLNLIKELKEKQDTAMIMISHDLGVIAQVCDKVAVIYAGQIVESGSLEEIFDHFSHPYTKGLFGSLPAMSVGERRLNSIPGMMPDPSDLPEGCKFHPRCLYATDKCEKECPEMQLIEGTHYIRCSRYAEISEEV